MKMCVAVGPEPVLRRFFQLLLRELELSGLAIGAGEIQRLTESAGEVSEVFEVPPAACQQQNEHGRRRKLPLHQTTSFAA